ncbi:uncharacterized protein BX663DRAFT_432901 [Cokeromyces recurvatus]|uniref:uncharacterized protein n=1 Tax=Cokeromyces recurvatus TaxID=90255 RepID=UPI00221F83C1|nr:uncharacterized protein BX663DRAFT_432901 [Cokeromyces recurvatus]KAI7903958.1 hypothetical protein BX663DRAFT_432901 [Cokeromyces recurvatus]
MEICCTDRNLSVTLTEINCNDLANSIESWLRNLNLAVPFQHFKFLKDKPENACRFFQRYGNKKLDEGKNTRVLASIDWNKRPISYEIPLNIPVSNPPPISSPPSVSNPQPVLNPSEIIVTPTMLNDNKVKIILLEAYIDDLESKIHEHEAAIHCLRAEIRSKEGQIKRRKTNY